jgi:hypothetical protein
MSVVPRKRIKSTETVSHYNIYIYIYIMYRGGVLIAPDY